MKSITCYKSSFSGICNSKENELQGGVNGRYEKDEGEILCSSAK